MRTFKYFSPKDVKSVCTLLSEHQGEAKIIAGGQSLVILLRQKLIHPTYLIDIKAIEELNYIQYDEKEGLRIGALTTHRTLETSPIVMREFFMLSEMETRLASFQVRNWGTLGGNLCHADFASDLSPTLIALDAEVKLTSLRGERKVKLSAFFKDHYETILRADELLTEIVIPAIPKNSGGVYRKANLIETDQGIAGVATFAVLDSDNKEICEYIRIVLGAVGAFPLKSKRAEELIRGQKVDDAIIEEAAQMSSEDCRPIADIHASEEYKREMIKVLVRKTVKKAISRGKAA